MLRDEFKYYLENQAELVKKYNGKFLVIKNKTVVESFDTLEEAYDYAVDKYELGTFLLQECSPGKSGYTQTFHSRVQFA